MKTIKLIGVFVVALVFLVGCAAVPIQPESSTNTPGTLGAMLLIYDEWDGPLDPRDFKDWKIIGHRPCPAGRLDYHVLLENPGGEIEKVEIVVILQGEKLLLIRYGYVVDGAFYVFGTDVVNKEKYAQIEPRGV